MKNTLAKRSTVPVVIVAGALALSGCLHTSNKTPEVMRAYPQGLIHGSSFRNRTEKDHPHRLEELFFYGEGFYVKKNENGGNTLPFLLYPSKGVKEQYDLDTKETQIFSRKMYIPMLVEGKEKVKLTPNSRVVKGRKIPGVRARIKKPNLKGDNFIGTVHATTEEGAPYKIKTTTIAGKNYFFPHVKNSLINTKGNMLNWYFIPKEGAKMEVSHPVGNIALLGDVFRPVLVKQGRIPIGDSPGYEAPLRTPAARSAPARPMPTFPIKPSVKLLPPEKQSDLKRLKEKRNTANGSLPPVKAPYPVIDNSPENLK